MLSAEDIYRTLAELLQDGDDLIFASKMVQTLSSILLTSKELFLLRRQLKDLSSPVSVQPLLYLFAISFFVSTAPAACKLSEK